MALLQHQAALESWTALMHTASLMVDYVQFATVQHYNNLLRPKVKAVISTTRGLRSNPSSTADIGEDLSIVLRSSGWNGDKFVSAVSAISLLATLKGFKLVSGRCLGKGAYAIVRLARSELTGEKIVMKEVLLDSQEHGVPVHVLRELALLKTLQHPNILRLYDVLYREEDVVLMLEYLDCNLHELLQHKGCTGLPLLCVKSYTCQMLKALAYAKTKRVMHRDLKPANILVNPREGVVKVADFGLGRIHNEPGGKYSRQVMTLRYRAPEVMLGVRTYTEAVDMWSVGCMMGEMVTGVTLFGGSSVFSGSTEILQLLKVFQALGTPTTQDWPDQVHGEDFQRSFPKWPKPSSLAQMVPGLDPEGLSLLTSMLEYNPAKRISASEALQHPWFRDVQLPIAPQ